MKTYATISMNYKKAVARADEIEELADRLSNISETKLEGLLGELSSAWRGDSADIFIQKGQNLSEQITESAKKLYKTAETVRKIAQNNRQADMQALEIATRRTYR
ncbi:MAG: WXG100 family type VII secretion target [Lachnospira sp.]|nr:WXG100 family type VII secretion target [Lachnospira sp.]